MSRSALRHITTVCGCVFASILMVAPAEAAIVFGTGTVGGVDTVDLGSPPSGFTLVGTVGPSNHEVLFSQPSSPEAIRIQGGGQAAIVPVTTGPGNQGFTSLRIQLSNGDLFSRFEMNPDFTSAGLSFDVYTDGGIHHVFTSQQGNSRFHVYGSAGETFRYIDLIAPTNSLTSVRQVRIGGITPAEVPEPSTWVMLTMGLAIVSGISRRKRASQQLA